MGTSASTAGALRRVPSRADRAGVAERAGRRISRAMTLAHALGAVDVFLLLFLVLPAPAGARVDSQLVPNVVAMAVYLPLTLVLGRYLGWRISSARSAWIREGRDPDPAERADVLAVPLHCTIQAAGMWLGAAVLFGAINLSASPELARHVATTIVLGGLTSCAVGYLLTERFQRPVIAMALGAGPPARPAWPGVEGRLVLAWLCASAVPVLGVVLVACDGLLGTATGEEVARAALVLGLAALVIGFVVTVAVARTLSRPLTAVRSALHRVEAGDLSTEVRVDDGSEVGLLQSGFNTMVDGLRERERMHDLYARQVGQDVARAALDEDPRLGGEVCEVAALFVDLIGSTALAAHAPPERVVARLNRFFAVVVDVVESHGGWVNKFEGDAALCVFGAPVPLDDPSTCALAAARALDRRLRLELPDAAAGIGVSCGAAVAGWVGAERRFEYTVIGDPVNEAARLCELAKRRPDRLLASAAAIGRAEDAERRRWRLGEETVLRGRVEPTRLAVPLAA